MFIEEISLQFQPGQTHLQRLLYALRVWLQELNENFLRSARSDSGFWFFNSKIQNFGKGNEGNKKDVEVISIENLDTNPPSTRLWLSSPVPSRLNLLLFMRRSQVSINVHFFSFKYNS